MKLTITMRSDKADSARDFLCLKVFCLLFVLSFIGTFASTAADILVADGVAYKLCGSYKYMVTSMPDGEYAGEVVIPTVVKVNGNFNGNVVGVESKAFAECESLTSVKVEGMYIREIGDSVFFGCPQLENVEITDSVRTIGKSLFENCTGLKTLPYVSRKATVGERLFAGCTGLEEIELAEDCNFVVKSMFVDCINLKRVTLTELQTIPDSIFIGCTNLEEIVVKRHNPDHLWKGSEFFSNEIFQKATLKVPLGRKNDYQCADVWKNFENIEEERLGYLQIYIDNAVGGSVIMEDSKSHIYEVKSGVSDTLNVQPNVNVTLKFSGGVGIDVEEFTVNGIAIACDHITSYNLGEVSENVDVKVTYKACSHKVKLKSVGFGKTYIKNTTSGGSTAVLSDGEAVYDISCRSGLNLITEPDYGYQLKSVKVDTTHYVINSYLKNSNKDSYSITSLLNRDIDVEVEYELLKVNLYVRVLGASGSLYINDKEVIAKGNDVAVDADIRYGDTIKIKTVPPEGYETSAISLTTYSEAYLHTLKVPECELVIDEDVISPWKNTLVPKIYMIIQYRSAEEYQPLNPEYGELTYSYCDSTATATVTGGTCGADLIIPSTVEKDDIVYTVNSLGDRCFEDNTVLKSVRIPATVSQIGVYAFSGCTNLERVDFEGEGLDTIWGYAFSACEKLHTLDIPKTVTCIGSGAFYNCGSLDNIEIPEGIDGLGYNTFTSCVSLKTLKLPNSLEWVGQHCFMLCLSLTELTFGDNFDHFTSGGVGQACSGCSGLKTLRLGKNITSMGRSTFFKASFIENVYVAAKNPPILNSTSTVFDDMVYRNATLHVPKNRASAYKAHEYWRKFKTIVEDETLGWYQTVNITNGEFGSVIVENDTVTSLSNKELVIEKGEEVRIKIIPDYGYNIRVFNGDEDITELMTDSVITLTDLADSTNVVISYEEIWNSFTVTSRGNGLVKYGDDLIGDGSVVYSLRHGANAELCFYTLNGYKVTSLKINGEEYIADLNNNYSYEIAPIEQDTEVFVEFGALSGLDEANHDTVVVSAENGVIIVRGVAEDTTIDVYNISGVHVYRGCDTRIAVGTRGVYIVIVDGTPYKVHV